MLHCNTTAWIAPVRRWISLIGFCIPITIFAAAPDRRDSVYVLDEVTCVASRLPRAQRLALRAVQRVDHATLAGSPAPTLSDLLGRLNGVHIRALGPQPMLADLTIRGGSFEQSAVLLDGVRVNDAQTGHHNLNLPVHLSDVERVEVLSGPGSSLFGPNAFSGAVNVVTRQGDRPAFSGGFGGGTYGLWESRLTVSQPLGRTRHRLSLTRAAADGGAPNTDFVSWSGFYRGSISGPGSTLHFSAGYLDKEFGASSFYTSAFPTQYEATETRFAALGLERPHRHWSLTPRVYWRQHRDDYLLDRTRPGFYRNRHRTDAAGAELQLTVDSQLGQTAVGGEANGQWLESTNLGTRERLQGGVFVEHGADLGPRLRITAGSYLYHYGEFGWQAWPDLAAGFELSPAMTLTGNVGWSFRIPSFTELYYRDPANIGDAALRPERAVSYQLGMTRRTGTLQAALFLFHRDSHDLIDWARRTGDEPWRVMNLNTAGCTGVEASTLWQSAGGHPVSRARLGYAWLASERERSGYVSKAALVYLRHQAVAEIGLRLPLRLESQWSLRYLVRESYGDVALVDARLARPFRRVTPYVSITNLLGRHWVEVGNISMPGRWLRAGLEWEVGL